MPEKRTIEIREPVQIVPKAKLADVQGNGHDYAVTVDFILDYLNMHENDKRDETFVRVPLRHLRRLRDLHLRDERRKVRP